MISAHEAFNLTRMQRVLKVPTFIWEAIDNAAKEGNSYVIIPVSLSDVSHRSILEDVGYRVYQFNDVDLNNQLMWTISWGGN